MNHLLCFGLGFSARILAQRLAAQRDLRVTLEVPPELPPMNEDLTIQLFQSVRELLFNVAKHAQVRAARLRLQRSILPLNPHLAQIVH